MIQLHCVPPRAVTPQVLLERAVNLPLEDVEVGSACLPACPICQPPPRLQSACACVATIKRGGVELHPPCPAHASLVCPLPACPPAGPLAPEHHVRRGRCGCNGLPGKYFLIRTAEQ